ncbi:mitofilin family membrane protein [Roseobacter sp. EG26]|uniref:COG4223 family protein n=1 Tax=Roseobacter sp. EG26 TaxID=3412477 RepID=UPI003CE4ACAB
MAKAKDEKDVSDEGTAVEKLQSDADEQAAAPESESSLDAQEEASEAETSDAEHENGELDPDAAPEEGLAEAEDLADGDPEDEVDAELEHEESAQEAQTEERPAPPPAPAQNTSSFWPAIFGGVIAALLGFIAGRGDVLDGVLPASMQRQAVDLAPIEAETQALAEANSALIERIDGLEAVIAATPEPVPERDEELISSVDALQSALLQMTSRLEAIESRPEPEPSAPVVDNSGEIAALQSALADLQTQLSEDEARARTEAERVLARAALTRVETAVDSGTAFEPALGALEEVAPVDVPDVLRSAAAEGVPTMSMLREGFPDAARAGLAAARAEVPESEVQGIGGFIRRQLSVRSVTPREGTDPDAILSRAEAAMKAEDLDTALREMDALPDAAKAAMQGWLDRANARKAARDATKSLSDSLTVN